MLKKIAKGIILIAGTTLLILVFYITLSKLMELFMPDGWMFYEVYSKWSFIFLAACLVELAHIGLSESHRKSINHKIVWASALTLVLSIYIFASSTIIVSEANIIVRSPFNPVGKVYYYQNIEQVKAYFTDNSFMNNLLMKNGGTFIYEIKLDDKVYEFQAPTINTESKYAEAETYAELEDFDTQLVALNIPKETSIDHAELNQLDPIYKNRFLRILSNP